MIELFLDTETTGLAKPHSQLLELAVVGQYGDRGFDTLVNPGIPGLTWPDAERIHGITPAMVADAPTLDQLRDQIRTRLNEALVVIYNATYDVDFLPGCLDTAARIVCAMRTFSELRRIPNDKPGRDTKWKWFKLQDAAEFVGHQWTGTPHRALADALACRSVWNWCARELDRQDGYPVYIDPR